MARGRALAHPVPARQTDLAIQLHGMNLPTLPVTGKGSQTGRVLLRRSGTVPPLPWSTFAPPLTARIVELTFLLLFLALTAGDRKHAFTRLDFELRFRESRYGQ